MTNREDYELIRMNNIQLVLDLLGEAKKKNHERPRSRVDNIIPMWRDGFKCFPTRSCIRVEFMFNPK